MKIKTMLTTLTSVTILVAGLSMSAFAGNGSDGYDSDTDHNHTGKVTDHDVKKAKPMKSDMQGKMKAMQAEMQAIINTEDKSERQALFMAHKEKMKGMMGMMKHSRGDCGATGSMVDKKEIDHQAETD